MLAVINKIHWCLAVCAVNGRPGYTTARSTVNFWWHSTRHWSDSEIFVKNRDFCLPHLHLTPPLWGFRRYIAITFGTEKPEWWKPDGEKILQICLFVSTEYMRRHRPRLCIASHSKNQVDILHHSWVCYKVSGWANALVCKPTQMVLRQISCLHVWTP